jgi:hypothetical protein
LKGLINVTCFDEDHINPLKAELNPIRHLMVLLGAHPILHINRIRVKLLLQGDLLQMRNNAVLQRHRVGNIF